MRFLAQRLAHTLFVLLGVSILTFALIKLAPGDYFEEMRMNPQISPETVAALRDAYGLDRSLPVTYLRWVRSVLRGDLGFSFAYNSPVWPLLKVRAANTLLLTLTALLCSWLVAIPIGVWAATRRGEWGDRACSVGTTLLLAIPDVLIALGLLAFALRTGWFPTGGMHSLAAEEMGVAGKSKDLILHLALPVLALVAGLLPVLIRHVRSALLEVLDSPYIQAARGHGIPRAQAPFSSCPARRRQSLNLLVRRFPGNTLEWFAPDRGGHELAGAGALAPCKRFWSATCTWWSRAVLFSTIFLVAGNLLADVLLHFADPRIRVE